MIMKILIKRSQRFWGTGTREFISGEQGNKGTNMRGTGEQRQLCGTGKTRNQNFDLANREKKQIHFRVTSKQVTPTPTRMPL